MLTHTESTHRNHVLALLYVLRCSNLKQPAFEFLCESAQSMLGASTSTHGDEQQATSRCIETVQYVRTAYRALGANFTAPTFCGTDNKANLLVATHSGSAARSRHFLNRYMGIQARPLRTATSCSATFATSTTRRTS